MHDDPRRPLYYVIIQIIDYQILDHKSLNSEHNLCKKLISIVHIIHDASLSVKAEEARRKGRKAIRKEQWHNFDIYTQRLYARQCVSYSTHQHFCRQQHG